MSAPQVSIGLPVYNGEPFLSRAIESLLGQHFPDLELVISDNGSTDATEDICRKYAAADSRVRYERHETNRGASWNFNRVLETADPGARYFTWAAADDERAPSYLSRAVAILDADETIALAHTGTADIDEDGYVLHTYQQPVRQLESRDPATRLADLLHFNHECFQAFGLIRHEIARATLGLGPYADADNVLLVELALRGRFVQDPEVLFFRRQHSMRSMVHWVDRRERTAWFDPGRAGQITFPAWRVSKELTRAIARAPLTADQRRRCYLQLKIYVRWNWQQMVKNVARSGVEGALAAARTARLRTTRKPERKS